MFDMGFLELLLIGIIALIVLGPERLPKAAKTVGLWVGKAKQGFESVKSEIDRELKVQELQQQIKEQKEQIERDSGFDDLKSSLKESKNLFEDNTNSILNESSAVANQMDANLDEHSDNTAASKETSSESSIESDRGKSND